MARTWQVVACAAAVGLAVAGTAITAAGPWEGGQRKAERALAAAADRAPAPRGDSGSGHEPAADVLAALGARTGAGAAGAPDLPLPTKQGLEDVLGPLLTAPGLGTERTAAVMDATTGKLVYGLGAGTPAIPASTIKIATAVAALTELGPEARISTFVAHGSGADEIVLVGRGDPTLTARDTAAGEDGPASLPELARSTARALKDGGRTKVRLRYDTSIFSGPAVHPIGFNDNIAPVVALMADEGRVDPKSAGHAPRVADPAADAAATFAELLRKEGVEVAGGPTPGRAKDASEGRIAEVRSLPLAELVERMLTTSDNDIAEALARQTALAASRPASFDGGAQAVWQALTKAGLPLKGASIHDGSGLNGADRLSAGLLARLLALSASPDHPELRTVLTGLPVAGFTGTLQNRYANQGAGGGGAAVTASTSAAAGLVRAKTGTLTGVNTLAGTVVDADGRLLTFAFTAKGTSDPGAAQAALDRLAAAVAGCGCR